MVDLCGGGKRLASGSTARAKRIEERGQPCLVLLGIDIGADNKLLTFILARGVYSRVIHLSTALPSPILSISLRRDILWKQKLWPCLKTLQLSGSIC